MKFVALSPVHERRLFRFLPPDLARGDDAVRGGLSDVRRVGAEHDPVRGDAVERREFRRDARRVTSRPRHPNDGERKPAPRAGCLRLDARPRARRSRAMPNLRRGTFRVCVT